LSNHLSSKYYGNFFNHNFIESNFGLESTLIKISEENIEKSIMAILKISLAILFQISSKKSLIVKGIKKIINLMKSALKIQNISM
jgi:replicative superfamily II helicase